MAIEGWVKLERKTITRTLMGDAGALLAWSMLSAWTTHQPRTRRFAGHTVALERGQCPTTVRGLAKACGMTPQVAARALKKLVKLGLIETRAVDREYTVVTVLPLALKIQHSREHSGDDSDQDRGEVANAAAGAGFGADDDSDEYSGDDSGEHSADDIQRDVTKRDGITETEAHNARARDRAMASWLHGRIEANAGCKVPVDFEAWASEIAALREGCGVSHKAIGYTAEWALDHDWWGGRVTSAEGLRSMFVTIAAQRRRDMKRDAQGGYGAGVGAHR